MESIIVAVVCNLIAVLILFSGIFSSLNSGWKVMVTKVILLCGCLVGAYFSTPFLSEQLANIPYGDKILGEPLTEALGVGVVNSAMFAFSALFLYAIDEMVCSILRHSLIKSLREKSENKAKLKRAKSINPKAEKIARIASWKALKAEYKAQNVWWKKLISGFIGVVIAVVVGVVALLPYGYAAERLNSRGTREYLEQGYDYTLNGIIDNAFEDFFDWVISVGTPTVEEEEVEGGEEEGGETPSPEEGQPETPEEGNEEAPEINDGAEA